MYAHAQVSHTRLTTSVGKLPFKHTSNIHADVMRRHDRPDTPRQRRSMER